MYTASCICVSQKSRVLCMHINKKKIAIVSAIRRVDKPTNIPSNLIRPISVTSGWYRVLAISRSFVTAASPAVLQKIAQLLPKQKRTNRVAKHTFDNRGRQCPKSVKTFAVFGCTKAHDTIDHSRFIEIIDHVGFRQCSLFKFIMTDTMDRDTTISCV